MHVVTKHFPMQVHTEPWQNIATILHVWTIAQDFLQIANVCGATEIMTSQDSICSIMGC